MEIYLLKSAACLALFFAFYKVFLERTSIHHFKRFYLFGSLVLSFIIPFITFTTFVETSIIEPIYYSRNSQAITYETVKSINYWPSVLWTIYGLGVLFFSVKFFRNLFTLIQKIRQNPKYKNHSFINILLKETIVPHTFFSYIFLNKEQFEKDEIPQEVMLHEEAHAIQKHSVDILLVEIIQMVFWFNPLLYFIKRSIKLNHEFLADSAVLSAGAEISEYQKILLAFSSSNFTPALAHSINYSTFKKRFILMKIQTSKRAIWLRSLLLLPLLSILIYGFSTKETVQKIQLSSYISTNDTIEDIQIKIDENSNISLNGKTVAISNLKAEINKLNTNLSVTQKQKYLWASIDIENDTLKNLAEKVGDILYTCNIRSWNITSLKGEKDSGLKHIPWNNPMSGKTINEAKIIYQNQQAEIEKFKNARSNTKTDEKNPWTIEVGEPVERNEKTGEIIQQKATKAEISEYSKLAKKYNAIAIEKRQINKADLERLETIFNKMTAEQKTKAQPFPECKKPPTPPKSTLISYNTSLNKNKNSNKHLYYYNDKLIPFSKAQTLLTEKPALKMYTLSTGEEKNTIILSEKPVLGQKRMFTTTTISKTIKAPSAENGNLYMAAEPPPPPNSNMLEYVKELAKRGATFYIGPHRYSAEEAIKMVEKSTNEVTIDVSKYPEVHLGGC